MSRTAPIIIVGAGPVGLSLALALCVRGADVVVFDQRPTIPDDLRATTLQPPTLELFESWGLLWDVVAVGRKVERLQYWDWDRAELLADLDYQLIAGDTPCPYRLHVPQSVVCERLLAAIEARRPGVVHFGHKVLGFEQVGEQVHVRVRDRDHRESVVVGSQLCGADGVGSTVREAMGSTFVGDGKGDAFLSCVAGPQVMDLIAHRMGVTSIAPVAYLYDKLDWTMVMQMRDRVRFLFRVLPGNDPGRSLTREAMAIRARRFLGPGAEGHLRGLGVYSVKQRVASSWRQGRVTLLGDAAHQAMPVGGNAMNGGIHDAHHLSVALAAGTDAVLAAYETQRRKHALTLAARADESYKGLSARGLWSRMTRNRYLRRLSHEPKLARDHLLRVSMLEGRAGDAELPDLGVAQ